MLLTKTVEVQITSNTFEYYKNKGYEIIRKMNKNGKLVTPRGTKIIINVEDLKDGSDTKVSVKCDNCGKILNISWGVYLKYLKANNLYYCNSCSTKLITIDKMRKTKLNNGKSFEQWCIENNRQVILDKWDYGLNKCFPNEICYSSSKKYWFKCDKHKEHKSELKNISNFTNGSEGVMNCIQCNSFAQWGINNLGKDFLERYWSDKNTVNPWEISYGSKKNIWIKCQEKDYHEDYEVGCNRFIQNDRCPYCSHKGNKKVHPKDSLGQYIIDNYGQEFLDKVWSDKNKKSPFEYTQFSTQKVWWRCSDEKHEDYYRAISNSNVFNFKCPQCSRERTESILQEKVRLYLEETNCTILHENNCTIVPSNPKTNYPLPFDNEIKELKLICEVNGEQHYNLVGFHYLQSKHNNTTPEQELHYQKLKDRYKRIKAIQQGYFYLEIPYWTDNKKETWKQLINNKLKEIIKLKEVI